MEWLSRKTSIAGSQISNWVLVLASGSRRHLDYLLIRHPLGRFFFGFVRCSGFVFASRSIRLSAAECFSSALISRPSFD